MNAKPSKLPIEKNPNRTKGIEMNHGRGRLKGSKNKVAGKLKKDIFQTYEELGGVDYLSVVATEQPAVFCNMLAKLIPAEIRAEIGRPGDFDHLSDEELDNAIIVKFQEQYRDRFPEIGGLAEGKGAETVHREPDSVHKDDQTGVSGGKTPSPDGGEAPAG